MFYANNLNERLSIENEAVTSYEYYANQRRLMLLHNSGNFAGTKRCQGANAANYAHNPYSFIYPKFKTPKIDTVAVKEAVENTELEPQDAKNRIIEIFKENLGEIYDERFNGDFDNLTQLIDNYRGNPNDSNRLPLKRELVRLIGKFTKGNFKEFYLNTLMSEIRSACCKESMSLDDAEPFPASIPFYRAKKIYELDIDETVFKEDAGDGPNSRKAYCLKDLLEIFRKMPKMGLLHMHTSASMQPEDLLNLLADGGCGNSYVILGLDSQKRGKLTFSQPKGIINIDYAAVTKDNLDKEDYYKQLIKPENGFDKYKNLREELIDLLSLNSERIDGIKYIWDEFNNIFARVSELFRNRRFFESYYTDVFKELVDDNIEYLELRAGFEKFDGAPGAETDFLDSLMTAEENAAGYAANSGKLFKLRVILCGNRSKERKFDVFQKMLKAARWANEDKYSDLIIGFDIVSEEDRGNATNIYSEFILNSGIYKYINFYLHDGETSWDFNTNMIDALLLSNRRVGHGFALGALPMLADNMAFEKNIPSHKAAPVNSTGGELERLDDLINYINTCEKNGGNAREEMDIKAKSDKYTSDLKASEDLEGTVKDQEIMLDSQKKALEESRLPYEEFKEQILSETVVGQALETAKASFVTSKTTLKAQQELLDGAKSVLEQMKKDLANKKGEVKSEKKCLDTAKCNLLLSKIRKKLSSEERKNIPLELHKKGSPFALEICPISNQMLRYTPDLRMHPANLLLHKGVQCVLANDDPQIFGNSGLSYDFLSAFLSWDLDIWQIKQLIVNSVLYSSVPEVPDNTECGSPYNSFSAALNRFNILWHRFLNEMVTEFNVNEEDIAKEVREEAENELRKEKNITDEKVKETEDRIYAEKIKELYNIEQADPDKIIIISDIKYAASGYQGMEPDSECGFMVYGNEKNNGFILPNENKTDK